MTDFLEKTFAVVRELSPEQQEAVAHAVLEIVEGIRETIEIPDDHKRAIDEATAEIERGEVISYEEMKAVFAELRGAIQIK
jgi:predicted transcriptional regulator